MNDDYLRRLFVRFYNSFGMEHGVICMITGVTVFAAAQAVRRKKNERSGIVGSLAAAALAVYYYLLYLYTIAFRPHYDQYRYKTEPFWSYKEAAAGSSYLWIEIVLNYIMFIPMGVLWAALLEGGRAKRQGIEKGKRRQRRKRKHILARIVFIALITSYTIELSQLFLKAGLCEPVDDVFNNVMGAVFGYLLWRVLPRKR